MCEREVKLTGGRVTANVSRRGDRVYRPCSGNAELVHEVLSWLEKKGVLSAPRFLGINEDGREMLTFLPGEVPGDLGEFSDSQLACAGRIIRMLHDALADFPGCGAGETVCHNDLSPCNFVSDVGDGLPYAVIDWDAAKIGHPLNDLAYALWMWCDIGNPDQSAKKASEKMEALISGYGLSEEDRGQVGERMLSEMRRVGSSVFPKEEQTIATRNWCALCAGWVTTHMSELGF